MRTIVPKKPFKMSLELKMLSEFLNLHYDAISGENNAKRNFCSTRSTYRC